LLVQRLQELRPDLQIIISTTTETGHARALELYAPPTPPLEAQKPRTTVIRYPLDFTSAINRVLDRLRPTIVALMELELWPNFILQCNKRNIPVVLINGRLTESSFRKYRLLAPFRVIPRMLRRLKVI